MAGRPTGTPSSRDLWRVEEGPNRSAVCIYPVEALHGHGRLVRRRALCLFTVHPPSPSQRNRESLVSGNPINVQWL